LSILKEKIQKLQKLRTEKDTQDIHMVVVVAMGVAMGVVMEEVMGVVGTLIESFANRCS